MARIKVFGYDLTIILKLASFVCFGMCVFSSPWKCTTASRAAWGRERAGDAGVRASNSVRRAGAVAITRAGRRENVDPFLEGEQSII